jgi:hypothetical protein
VIGDREWHRAHRVTEEVDSDVGVPRRECLQCQDPEVEGTPGRDLTGEEADAGAGGGAWTGGQPVAVEVAPELEMVGGHAVAGPELGRQPWPGRDGVEPEPVRGLSQQGLAAGRVEHRLKVLHNVDADTLGQRRQRRVGSGPRRGDDGMGVIDAVGRAADVGPDPRPPLTEHGLLVGQ